jgi:hypothetical protein
MCIAPSAAAAAAAGSCRQFCAVALQVSACAHHDSSLACTADHTSPLKKPVLKLFANCAVFRLQDLKQLLADNPSDASLQRLVADLKQAYAKQVQQAVQAAQQQGKPQQSDFEFDEVAEEQQAQAGSPAAEAAAAAAAAEPVSHVQRHRIVIEETDGSGSEDEEDACFVPAAAAAAATAVQQPQAVRVSDSNDRQQDTATTSAQTAVAAAAGQQPSGGKAAASSVAAPNGTASSVPRAAAAASQRLVQQLSAKQPNPPRTATEFISTAKLLSAAKGSSSSSSSQGLGQYVRQLDPAKYKAVFKRELSEGLIRWLVQGLQALVGEDPQFVAQALLQLSTVERFGMVLPMAAANKATTAALQGLLDKLAAAGQDMAPLKAVYKLR